MFSKQKVKKIFAVSFLTLVLTLQVGAFLFLSNPKPAQAQVTFDPTVYQELIRQGLTVNVIKPRFTTALKIGFFQALTSATTFFFQKLASDAATWVASGGQGQGALIFSKGWEGYMRDVALDAVADFAGNLSDGLNIPGVNLCNPSLSIILKIQLGLLNQTSPKPPRCSWNQVSGNWDSFSNSVATGQVLNQIGASFEPGQSPLGAALEVNNIALFQRQINKVTSKINERLEGGGFKAIKDYISGNVKTPAEITQTSLNMAYTAGYDLNKISISSAYFNSDVGMALLRSVIATFTSTLVNQLVQKFATGLLSLGSLIGDDEGGVSNPELLSLGGRDQARQIFGSLQTVAVQSSENYDVLGEFTVCTQNRGPNNCVMDAQFAAAVRQSLAKQALTVGEAIAQGLLQGSWALIPPSNRGKNQDPYCFNEAFCYANLVKLRRARILPVGWELAASSPANSSGSPVTLQYVMGHFNDCNASGVLDADHPWCHLIDPNWVLKYPRTQCRASVFGPTLETAAGDSRSEVCVDTPSCNAQDDEGNCVGGWGYCVKEKNIWRFDGDSCPAYYNTCQTFSNSDQENQRQISVLTNTVDYGICNADNAGCKWYATKQEYRDSIGDRVCSGGPNQGNTCTTDAECTGSYCIVDQSTATRQAVPDIAVWQNSKICIGGPNNGSTCTSHAECGITPSIAPLQGCYQAIGRCVRGTGGGVSLTGQSCLSDSHCGDGGLGSCQLYFGDRIYLNGQAAQCDAAKAGCTELIPKQAGVTLNLIRNSSFEDDTTDPIGKPDFWNGTANQYSTDGVESYDGSDAVLVSNGHSSAGSREVYQRINISPLRFYTISVNAKRLNPTSVNEAYAYLDFHQLGSAASLSMTGNFTNCDVYDEGRGLIRLKFTPPVSASGTPPAYGRGSCTFTAPQNAAYMYVFVAGEGSGVYVDAVQLEESEVATAYGNGYSGTGASQRVYLKKPPAGLCNGNANDPEICSNYASSCESGEVGCELYTPASGDPSIPGIARASDQCPAACVGYETFREEQSYFDRNGDYPVYFIPNTARSCSAANAGCDEFTRVETGAGAENREYFTYLRLCEAPDLSSDTGTYYTWEGSEEAGYQLRTWILKTSDYISPVRDVDPSGGRAPCTNYRAPATLGEAGSCADSTTFSAPDNCNERADIYTNPDCREFYDSEGNIHYRLYSLTVTKNNECIDYRKTETNESDCEESGGRWNTPTSQCFYHAYLPDSQSCPASENSCRLYTGNAGRNVQVILSDDFEDGDTSGWSGGTISNESLATTGHSIRKTATTIDRGISWASISNETLLLSFWAKGTPGQNLEVEFEHAPTGRESVAALQSEWRYYQFGPINVDWTSANTCSLSAACTETGGCPCSVSGASVCTVSNTQTSCQYEKLQFNSPAAVRDLFIDNIVLKKVNQNLALIKNSWNTPAVCDATPEGAYRAQAMLGCAAYRDRAGNTLNLKSFSKLCRENSVGCEAFFDTQNSTSPYAETYNFICMRPDRGSGPCRIDPDGNETQFSPVQVCTITPGKNKCTFKWDDQILDSNPLNIYATSNAKYNDIWYRFVDGTQNGTNDSPVTLPFFYTIYNDLTIVPADTTVYLIDSETARCEADAKGCTALGLPILDSNWNLTIPESFSDTYLLNRPDDYDRTLCQEDALRCEAWSTPQGSLSYFKDPMNLTCEYRPANEGLTAPGVHYGWFKTGTNEPCYSNYEVSSQEYGIWRNRAVCSLASTCPEGAICQCPEAVPAARIACFVAGGQNTCIPYQGRVGTCTEQYSSCTEFLDSADKGTYKNLSNVWEWPNGKPYDYLDNQKLDEATSTTLTERCQGQASQKAGCVLFNDTSDPILRYNVGATYLKSKKNNYEKVTPVSCGENSRTSDADMYCKRCGSIDNVGGILVETFGDYCVSDVDCGGTAGSCRQLTISGSYAAGVQENDTNRILKVRRDRDCAEWLTCSSSQEVWDPRINQYKEICYDVGVCSEYNASTPSQCSKWVENEPSALTRELYSSRDVSWYGKENTGYSVPGKLPIDLFDAINVGKCSVNGATCSTDGDCGATGGTCGQFFVLGRSLGSCAEDQGAACQVGHCSNSGVACQNNSECTGASCVGYSSGICYAGVCAQNQSGQALTIELVNETGGAQCRAYPEMNSPFPGEVVALWKNGDGDTSASADSLTGPVEPSSMKSGFQNVKICENGEDCECSYKKVTYEGGSVIEYHDAKISSPPSKVCESGSKAGMTCTTDEECGTTTVGGAAGATTPTSRCIALDRQDTFYGIEGFCLENDLSLNLNGNSSKYACASWWPIDQIPSATDIYGQFAEAGFDPTQETQYCAQTQITRVLQTGGLSCDAPVVVPAFGAKNCGEAWDCINDQNFRDNCPPGFFMVFYGCEEEYDDACGYIGYGDECPYQCVPEGSVHTKTELSGANPEGVAQYPSWDAGDVCGPWDLPSLSARYEIGGGRISNISIQQWYTFEELATQLGHTLSSPAFASNKVVFSPVDNTPAGGRGEFLDDPDDLGDKNPFMDCVKRGVPESVANYALGHMENTPANFVEVSCRVAVQTSVNNPALGSNKAWTNRVWSGSSYKIGASPAGAIPAAGSNTIDYGYNSANTPFGQLSESVTDSGTLGKGPAWVAMCGTEEGFNGPAYNLPPSDTYACLEPLRFVTFGKVPAAADSILENTVNGRSFALTQVIRSGLECLTSDQCNSVPRSVDGGVAVCKTTCSRECTNNGDCLLWGGTCLPAENSDSEGSVRFCEETRSTCDPDEHNLINKKCSGGLNNGRSCENDAFCRPLACVGNVCVGAGGSPVNSGYTLTTPSEIDPTSNNTRTNIDKGLSRIKELFARSYDYFEWDYATPAWPTGSRGVTSTAPTSYQGGYNQQDIVDGRQQYDISEIGDGTPAGTPTPPRIFGVRDCEGESCWAGDENTVSVNGRQRDAVSGIGGQLRAVLQFFAHADSDQMPIRKVIIKWGDGPTSMTGATSDNNYYQNHNGKSVGNMTPCQSTTDFGNSEAACDTKPFQFMHVYRCVNPSSLPHCGGGVTTNCSKQVGESLVCVYKPRVYVLDNWGWCASENGCPGGPGENYDPDNDPATLNNRNAGCYDALDSRPATDPARIDECSTSNPELMPGKDPWVYFDGEIQVVP